jgi:hypothetical protein
MLREAIFSATQRNFGFRAMRVYMGFLKFQKLHAKTATKIVV